MSDRKKMVILKALMDGKSHTYHALAKSLKTNYWTVRKNCNFLVMLSLVEGVRAGRGEASQKRRIGRLKITDKGAEFIRKYLQQLNGI